MNVVTPSPLTIPSYYYQGTALHVAASYGHVESISDLIIAGAPINTVDEVSSFVKDTAKLRWEHNSV